MGNDEEARAEASTVPGDEIEVEHPFTPPPPGPPPERAFRSLQGVQHARGIERAFDQGHGIGEVPARAADRPVEDDRRRVEQQEILVQPRNRRFDYAGRTSVADVSPVGSDRDGIEMRCALHQRSPRLLSCNAPPPPTCRLCRAPSRRVTARCVRGWPPFAKNAATSMPAGGMRPYRRLATRGPGWQSSGLHQGSMARTARDGPLPGIMQETCSMPRSPSSGSAKAVTISGSMTGWC